MSIGYQAHPLESGTYPWIGGAANDYAMANIGQAKNLFSFNVASWNWLPVWWQLKYFGHTGINARAVLSNLGGITMFQAYQQGLNPFGAVSGTSTPTPVGPVSGPTTDPDHGSTILPTPPSLSASPYWYTDDNGDWIEDQTTADLTLYAPGSVQSIEVQRRNDAGAWTTIATLNGSATDYEDDNSGSGLLANVDYKYRLWVTYTNAQAVPSNTASYAVPLFTGTAMIKTASVNTWKVGITEFTNPSNPPKYYLIENDISTNCASDPNIASSGYYSYNQTYTPSQNSWSATADWSLLNNGSYPDPQDYSYTTDKYSANFNWFIQGRSKHNITSTSQANTNYNYYGSGSYGAEYDGDWSYSTSSSSDIQGDNYLFQGTYQANNGNPKWMGSDFDMSKGSILYSGNSSYGDNSYEDDTDWPGPVASNFADSSSADANGNWSGGGPAWDPSTGWFPDGWSAYSWGGANYSGGQTWYSYTDSTSSYTAVLTQEYTTDAFIGDVINNIADYPDDFTTSYSYYSNYLLYQIASRSLNSTQDNLGITKGKYQLQTNPSASGVNVTICDVFQPDPDGSGNYPSPQVIATHTFAGGSGTMTGCYEIDPTSEPGTLTSTSSNGTYSVIFGVQINATGQVTDPVNNGPDSASTLSQTEKTSGAAIVSAAYNITGSFSFSDLGLPGATYTISITNASDFTVTDDEGNTLYNGEQITEQEIEDGEFGTSFTIAANGGASQGMTCQITLTASDGSGNSIGSDTVTFTNQLPSRTYTIPFDEASGARYRKIALNGRPMADEKPHQTAESDEEKEETYIDALNLGLHHSTTDVYVPVAGSDLTISARRDTLSEVWNMRSGLRPHERFDRPFGIGWSSNLCPNLEYVSNTVDNVTYYYITDQNGASHRFIQAPDTNGAPVYVPLPSDSRENGDYLSSFDGQTFTDRYGMQINFASQPTATQTIGTDRDMQSGTEYHNHYRVNWIKDRLGNMLTYQYPPSVSATTLIPATVTLSGHSDQTLSINQDINGHVTDIWDPNGNHWQYGYSTQSYTYNGQQYYETFLTSVTAPDGGITRYCYADSLGVVIAVEQDQTPTDLTGGMPTNKYHSDLASIQDPRQNTYSFGYQFDQTKWDYNTQDGYFKETGAPRNVISVTLPAGSGSTTFVNNSTVKVQYSGATQSLTQDSVRQITVTDATRSAGITYTFGVGAGSSQVFDLGGMYPNTPTFAIPKIVFYENMKIDYGAPGYEVFTFDPTAGLALGSVQDLSGNTTSYTYGDSYSVPILSIYQNVFQFPNFFTKYEDPTVQTDAMNNTKRFTYGPYRIMASVTDEDTRLKTWQVDSLGRRLNEIIYASGSGSSVVQETDYTYNNSTFPGFVTSKTIRGLSGPSWAVDLTITYTPDGDGRVMQEVVDPTGLSLSTTYKYDANWNKLSKTDPMNKTTWFGYDSRNRLATTNYYDGTQRYCTYDQCGNKTAEYDENGYATLYQYDALNRLQIEARDMNGNGHIDAGVDLLTQYGYNNVNSKTTITDPRNKTTTIFYDSLQRSGTIVTPGDAVTAPGTTLYDYSGANSGGNPFDSSSFKPTKVTDAIGYITTFTYDPLYRELTRSVQYAAGCVSTGSTGYDNVGNPTSHLDPLSKLTTTQFDALNRPYLVVEAAGTVDSGTTQTLYTATGLKWETIDQNLNPTITHYDSAGRADYVVTPPAYDAVSGTILSGTMWSVLDRDSNVIAKIDPLLNETDYAYDFRNRKIAELAPPVEDNLGGGIMRPLKTWGYDPAGNIIATTENFAGTIDGNGNISVSYGSGDETDTTYDRANRPYMVQGPPVIDSADGNAKRPTTTSYYDFSGNIIQVTDPKQYPTYNGYDAMNRLVSGTDGAGNTFGYQYDTVGNRTAVTDGKQHTTYFGYDGLKRNTTITDPLNETTTFFYDALNKTGRLDANGAAITSSPTTSYGYDNRNRLTSVTYTFRPSDNRIYYYDRVGNLLNVTEPNNGAANVSYVYDARNRVTQENSGGSFNPSSGQCTGGMTHNYGYDLAGNRVNVLYAGDSSPFIYIFDAMNRLSGILETGRATSYGYDLAGNLTGKMLPNLDVESMGYDAMHRMTSQQSTSGQTVQYGYIYGRDLNGNLATITETGLPPYNQSQVFSYDGANRLTDESSSAFGREHYNYDGANNRYEADYWPAGSGEVVVTSSFNAVNELTWMGSTTGTSSTYGYDFNGNRTSRSTGASIDLYGYDQENRLVSGTIGGIPYGYIYDYRTRRIQRVENGIATQVLFSGGVSVKEFQSNGSLLVEYIRGHDLGGGIGSVLYTNRSGGLAFDHYNSRGDVVVRTDNFGGKTYMAWYDAFGTHTHDQGTNTDRQQTNTRDEDPDGLLYENHRPREMQTNLYVVEDPLGRVPVNESGNIMMPKEKWYVDHKEVSEAEYEEALEPGLPQVQTGPTKSAKNTGKEANMHTAVASGEAEILGQQNHYHTTAAGFPNLYTYVNQNPWTFFDPEGLDAVPVGNGLYKFVVNPANFGASSLDQVASLVSGKYVANPNPGFSGQCATGAQYLTGEKVNGNLHDSPATWIGKQPNWTQGAPLSRSTQPGTMVSWGWDANGHYPNAASGNHTAIYMGVDSKGRPLVMEQNVQSPNSPAGQYHVRPVQSTEHFFEVNAPQRHDPKRSDSSIQDTK